MDFNPHITSTERTTDARKIETELFYLVKQQKELLLAKVVSVQPITVHWYRSLTDVEEKDYPKRKYVPVWMDKNNDREDWSELTERTLPEFEEMTTQIQPKKIAKIPGFTLKNNRIPTESVRQGMEWIKQHPKYYQRVGGRSWAPLKAKIGHRGALLLTDKQKKKKKKQKSMQERKKNQRQKQKRTFWGKGRKSNGKSIQGDQRD